MSSTVPNDGSTSANTADKSHVSTESGEEVRKECKPICAKPFPLIRKLEVGKTYLWCQCGHSKDQPFCDGTHPTECKPVSFKVEHEQSRGWGLCGCKYTNYLPVCNHWSVSRRASAWMNNPGTSRGSRVPRGGGGGRGRGRGRGRGHLTYRSEVHGGTAAGESQSHETGRGRGRGAKKGVRGHHHDHEDIGVPVQLETGSRGGRKAKGKSGESNDTVPGQRVVTVERGSAHGHTSNDKDISAKRDLPKGKRNRKGMVAEPDRVPEHIPPPVHPQYAHTTAFPVSDAYKSKLLARVQRLQDCGPCLAVSSSNNVMERLLRLSDDDTSFQKSKLLAELVPILKARKANEIPQGMARDQVTAILRKCRSDQMVERLASDPQLRKDCWDVCRCAISLGIKYPDDDAGNVKGKPSVLTHVILNLQMFDDHYARDGVTLSDELLEPSARKWTHGHQLFPYHRLEESQPWTTVVDKDPDLVERTSRALISYDEITVQPRRDHALQRMQHAITMVHERIVKKVFQDGRVIPFGSAGNGLLGTHSDIDLSVVYSKECWVGRDPHTNLFCVRNPPVMSRNEIVMTLKMFLKHARKQLGRNGCVSNVQPILHARTPIVRLFLRPPENWFQDEGEGIQVDLSLCHAESYYAIVNTALIRSYISLDPSVALLLRLVKHWASRRCINVAPHGTLSSYSFALLVIHFCQSGAAGAALLPVLQDPTRGFEPAFEVVDPAGFAPAPIPVSELLRRFFYYYGYHPDTGPMRMSASALAFSPRTGGMAARPDFYDTSVHRFQPRHQWNIEDPFEENVNTGRVVWESGMHTMLTEFRRAYYMMTYGEGHHVFEKHVCFDVRVEVARACEDIIRVKRTPDKHGALKMPAIEVFRELCTVMPWTVVQNVIKGHKTFAETFVDLYAKGLCKVWPSECNKFLYIDPRQSSHKSL